MNIYFKKHRGLFSLTVVIIVILSAATASVALLLENILDLAVSGDMSEFVKWIVISTVFFVLFGLLSYIYALTGKILICRIVKLIREKIFAGIIRRNYVEFQKNGTADYLSALTNDVKIVEDNYLVPLLDIIYNGVTFTAAVGILFYFDVIIAVCVLGAILLMFIVPGLFGAAVQKRQEHYSNSLSEFTSHSKDMLSGFDVIKSYGIVGYIISRFDRSNSSTISAKLGVEKIVAASEAVAGVMGIFVQFGAIFLSAFFIINGRISVGALVGIMQTSGFMIGPLSVIFQNAPKLSGAKPVIKRLNDFVNFTEDSKNEPPAYQKNISAKNLMFSYDGENNILRGVDLVLQKGGKYAIVGKSGCGKTTLAKLLCGYYSEYGGEIRYDDTDLKSLSYDEISSLSSTIHQGVYVFNESVYDNICLHQEYEAAETERALKLSGVSGFINQLPNGLDTLMEENGSNLSGGQKQRIAVARAIIRQKPILVLDEGTSAIDMQTAYDIESSLLNIEDLTLITITHNMREDNLRRYGRIIFMDDGKIAEKGTYDELINKQGGFYDFLQI